MQTATSNTQHEPIDAVTEAARTAADASRRTLEGMQAATQVTRTYLDEATDMSRKLFSAWAMGAETTMKAMFEVQTAGLSAGLSLLDTAMTSNRGIAKQWTAMAYEAQQAALNAWRTNIQAAEKLALGAKSGETAAK